MEGMFSFSDNFTNLDLNMFDTSKVSNFNKMFEGCTGIKDLNLTSFDFINGQSFNDIFNLCENMTVYLTNYTKENNKFIEIIPQYVKIEYVD
jgi:surface protein